MDAGGRFALREDDALTRLKNKINVPQGTSQYDSYLLLDGSWRLRRRWGWRFTTDICNLHYTMETGFQYTRGVQRMAVSFQICKTIRNWPQFRNYGPRRSWPNRRNAVGKDKLRLQQSNPDKFWTTHRAF